jgi:hypothetical protein
VVAVRTAQQVVVAVLRALEQVLGVHVRVAGRPVGVALVELDHVVRADVLRRRELVEDAGDPGDQIVAPDRAGGRVARRVVGVDGIGEAIGEHLPVAAVDTHGVPDHLLADLDAVFETANASFEVGGHTSPPFRRSRFQRPATPAPGTGAAGPSATTG